MRISEKLCYSKKNLSTFESLKKAVLKINNNYWRRISDDNHKKRTVCTLQNYTPRTWNFEQGLLSSPIDITSILLTTSTECHCSLLFPNRPFHNSPLLLIFGSNEKLTLLEHQCYYYATSKFAAKSSIWYTLYQQIPNQNLL